MGRIQRTRRAGLETERNGDDQILSYRSEEGGSQAMSV